VDAAQIDAINILQASRLAMLNAVLKLRPEPDFLLVDAVCLDHPARSEPSSMAMPFPHPSRPRRSSPRSNAIA